MAPAPTRAGSVRPIPAMRTWAARTTRAPADAAFRRTAKRICPELKVLTDVPGREPETLLAESVLCEMVTDEHCAAQRVERLGWALVDAEQKQRAAHT